MLEPLFRCNLACAGCGKIDYPDAILNQRLSVKECLDAVDECGAPVVAIPGGEPLIHKEIGEIVAGIVARKKFVSLCTNALLLEKKLHLFKPSPYLFFTGASRRPEGACTTSRCPRTAFTRSPSRRSRRPRTRASRVNINATIFDGHAAEDIADVPRHDARARRRRVDLAGLRLRARARPGAFPQSRARPRNCSATSSRWARAANWAFQHSPLFLDFLAGNQELPLHALGHADAQRVRLAEALLSPRRGLRRRPSRS